MVKPRASPSCSAEHGGDQARAGKVGEDQERAGEIRRDGACSAAIGIGSRRLREHSSRAGSTYSA